MVSLALQEAFMQDPLITIRVVIFASWWKRTYQFGVYCFGLTPSHQVFMRIMAPISAILQCMADWLILVSSELVTSVSRCGIRSLPFMARSSPDGSTISCDYSRIFCQPPLLQRPSGIVSWATFRPLVFSFLTGCSEWGCSSLASRINGISWTTSFRSPGSLSIESFSSLVDFSGPAAWGTFLLFSSQGSPLLIRRFGCGLQALIGERHTWGLSSPHQKILSITLRELLAVQFGLRALKLLLVDLSVTLF